MDIRETPWLTPESVTFLEQLIISNPEIKILEFGCGGSTIWFSRKLPFPQARLVTVEHDPEWFQAIKGRVKPEVEIRLEKRPYAGVCNDYPDEYFDLVLIDGRDRVLCAAHAMRIVKHGGFIMLDNAERVEYTPIGPALLKEWEYKQTAQCDCPEAPADGVHTTDIWRKPLSKNVANVADDVLVAHGETAARGGDFESAEALARLSLEKNMHVADALNLLAIASCSRERTNDAFRLLEAGHVLEPANANVGKNLAMLYTNLGRRDEALGVYNELLTAYPMDQDIHNALRGIGAVALAGEAERIAADFDALMPTTFLVEVSCTCNLKCPDCAIGSGLKKSDRKFMSLDEFKSIAEKIRPYAKETLLHIWDEPMLNPDIYEMIRIASEFSIVNISTNGLMLTKEKAQRLITSGVSQLIVSIDGVSQEVYSKYRVGGNVEKAKKALKTLAEYNNKHGANVWIIPQFIVFKHNQHEMTEFEDLCNSLGLKACFKAPYLRSASGLEESDSPQYRRERFTDEASQRGAISACAAARKDFTILIDGSVVLCRYDYAGKTRVGNIFEQDVMDIWRSDGFRNLRWRVIHGDPPTFCKTDCLSFSIETKPTVDASPAGPTSRRRTRVPGTVTDPQAALQTAHELFSSGRQLEAFDLYEQILESHPRHSVRIMADACDRYTALPDQNDRYALYQARLFDFDIKPTNKVLDVGSGHAPFPLATHLADLELSEGWTGRGGAPFKHIDGKLVYQCNIESLPFADKEFDFVYCSHVLEHVDNPEIACRELMRVAKRGYIETPTRGKDLWMDAARQSNHKWAIEEFNGTLVFTQYSERDIAGLHCDALMGMHIRPETPREKAITSLLYLKADLFNTMFMWDDSFAVEVRRLESHMPAQVAAAPMPVPDAEPGHVFTCGRQAGEDWLRQTTLRINQACGDPEKLVALAGELAERGHDDTAEELARMVISRDPSFADAHNVLGVIYYSRGKERDALRYFETANRLDPGNVDIGQNLITAYVDLEQHEKAVAVCRQMLQIRQNDPRLLEIIGNLVQTIGDKVADTLDGLNNQDIPAPPAPSQDPVVPVVSGNPFPETGYKPKLKYSFGMIVLNGDDFIEYAIKSVYDFAHEIIIVEGAVQEAMFMVGPDGGSRDKTIEIIESFPDPDHKIRLIRGKWTDKTEQSNVYMRLATGDYVWQIDSDEVYKWEDLVKLDEILAANQDSVDMVSITALNFYHNLWTIGKGGRWEAKEDPIRRIFKNKPGAHFTTHWPPTLVYGDGSTVVGHLEQDTLAQQFGIYFYHYSYITRKQVQEKVEYYNRKGYSPVVGSDLSTWYDEVWSKWTHPGCEVEKLHGSHVNRRQPTWTEYFTGEHPEVMKSHPLFNFERPSGIAPDSSDSPPADQVNKERHGSEYGGWWICPDRLDQNSVIYSFGIGEDISFDLSIIDKFGANVHAFDPTPRALDYVRKQHAPEKMHVQGLALAAHDGEELFYPPENTEHVSHTLVTKHQTAARALKVNVKRLATIMRELGHTHIDLLKMDIEGSEYEVLPDILDSGIDVDQILVEFHHNVYPGLTLAQSQAITDRLVQAGYDLFSVEGSDCSFIKIRRPNRP